MRPIKIIFFLYVIKITRQENHATVPDPEPRKNSAIFYGTTYYPWRSITRDCDKISAREISQDFIFLSATARNVQILDLYCNLTQSIVSLTRKHNMGLMLGLSAEDDKEYERQRNELKMILKNENLSHILAITVGRTSMIRHKGFDKKINEIQTMIRNSPYHSIPVTMIIDDHSESQDEISGYFERVRVISAKSDVQSDSLGYLWRPDPQNDPTDFYNEFISSWSSDSIAKQGPKNFYTEFGFPMTCCDKRSGGDNRAGDVISSMVTESGPPPFSYDTKICYQCSVSMLRRLACSTETSGPGDEQCAHYKYFYDSAFDAPFMYTSSDKRSQFGLADFNTRQPKAPVAILEQAAEQDKGLRCYPDEVGCDPPQPEPEPILPPYVTEKNGIDYQWLGIGASLSLALTAILVVAFFVVRRRRLDTEQKRKQKQDEGNGNLCNVANYLARHDYIDIISMPDYENLAALVGPGWLIHESTLKFEEIVGEGHFGIVQRAKLSRDNKIMDVAVKRLHVGAKNIRKFLSEGILMEKFRHQNTLPLIGISFTSYYLPMIVTPFMEKGDLLTYLKNIDNRLTVRELLQFSLEIALGVHYLHNLKLIHRDLAARNCMLDESLTVMIADFGLCRDISDSDSYQTARASDIPVRWMPPETIQNLQWTQKSDSWSFGVVLWEIFTRGKPPYLRVPLVELRPFLCNGGRLSKPDGCPDIIYELMKSCWHHEAEQRPDFNQLREQIPALVKTLEIQQILDLPGYYNALTVAEMSQQS